jgi:hypothetical protein
MSDPSTCPESTIESANRRNFIKKAALTTAAAGVGSTFLAKSIVPDSSATSCACNISANCVVVGIGKNCGCIAGTHTIYGGGHALQFGKIVSCGGIEGVCGGAAIASAQSSSSDVNYGGLDFYTDYTKRVSITKCGKVGIGTAAPLSALCVNGYVTAATVRATCKCASSRCCTGIALLGKATGSGATYGVLGISCSASGAGVAGIAVVCGGRGVVGFSCTGTGIPLVAEGPSCQSAPLQQWIKGCIVKSVVNKCGYLGIGTSTPSTPLDVLGSSPLVGTIKSNASSGDRSSLVQFANGDTTGVDWNIGVAGLCNSIKVPDGYFYVQHSTSTTPAISVNKCNNHVGIGIANPCRVLCVNGRIHTQCGMGLGTQTINTTLAINGSVSMKSRQVSSTPVTLTLSDFAVLVNATSQNISVALPSIASTAAACNGMILFIKKSDSSTHTVTITPSSTDQIEGASSKVLTKQWDSLELISNNSSSPHQWVILGSSIGDAFIS